MSRLLYALTHVASQLCGRWLAPPPGAPRDDPHPERATLADLRDALALHRDALPWLDRFIPKYDPDLSRLPRETARYFRQLTVAGGAWLCPLDAAYPPLLRELRDPPHGLAALGDTSVLASPLVAVVGSRKASAFAIRESYELGMGLAVRGITVVSGGAFGCDVAAHHGVLASSLAPAAACCIFPSGLGALMPRAHLGVFRRLAARGGVLLSERLWDATPHRHDFHARNRLISGMAALTAVMQAGERSGAVVTARLALDQGRDLAVLAHPDDDVRALGSRALIADGAPPIGAAAELLARLAVAPPASSHDDAFLP